MEARMYFALAAIRERLMRIDREEAREALKRINEKLNIQNFE